MGLAALILVSSCSAPPPNLPPDEIIQRTAKAMLDQQTMHFKIDISGARVTINPALGLSLRSSEGDFARPDRMGLRAKIISPVAAMEADMIALGDEQYITNFLTKQWELLPAEFGFNPAVMFHSEFGLEKTLEAGLDDTALVGIESIDGAQTYRVKGSLAGTRLQFMSGGLISTGRVDVEVWVDTQTFNIRRTVLVDHRTDAEEPTTWSISFSQFGEPVEIEAPIE
ncbi:MAG: LppX_LprAFG lipoprotein [Terriglobales bacterium]